MNCTPTATIINGSVTAKIPNRVRAEKTSAKLKPPLPPADWKITLKAINCTATAMPVNNSAARYLPSISPHRSTGLMSSGSNEPRSRSPDVVSMAR